MKATYQKPVSINQPLNFALGLLLFVVAIFFLFQRESFGIKHGHQFDALFIGISGVMSLWASFSDRAQTVYRINLGLALFYLFFAVLVYVFQLNGVGDRMNVMLDFTRADLFSHFVIGCVFLYNAASWKKHSTAVR